MQYKASMKYGPEEIRLTESVVHNTFHLKTDIISYAICLAIIVFGFFSGSVLGYVFLAAGCLALTQVRTPERMRVRNMQKGIGNRSIAAKYEFTGQEMACTTEQGRTILDYHSIIRMVFNGRYLFIFPDRAKAYVVDCKTLVPDNLKQFQSGMEGKAGLKWTTPTNILSLSLPKFKFDRENTRN